jgi:tyrosinase
MRIRKNVKSLSSVEKTNFVNAVLALKHRPSTLHPSDTSMTRYDDFVETHMNAMNAQSNTNPTTDPNWLPGWAHQGPAFFPWHRELLLQFENELQAIDSTVTIPYWDWTDNSSWPFTADFMGSDGDKTDPQDPLKVKDGPFAIDGPNHWTLNMTDSDSQGNPGPNYLQRGFGRDPSAKKLPTASNIQSAKQKTPYDSPPWKYTSDGFRTMVEYPIHNLVHRYVNGTMGLMASPNDPVFWLHHCNIDRLWGDWQRLHLTDAPYLPTQGGTLGHNLNDTLIFNTDPPPPWAGSVTPAMLIDHHILGYSYESDPPQAALIVRAAPSISKNERSVKHVIPVFPLMSEIKLISRRRPQRKNMGIKRKRLPKRVVSKKGKRRINRRGY